MEGMDHIMLSPQDTKRFPGVGRWPGTDAKAPSTGWLGEPSSQITTAFAVRVVLGLISCDLRHHRLLQLPHTMLSSGKDRKQATHMPKCTCCAAWQPPARLKLGRKCLVYRPHPMSTGMPDAAQCQAT